MYQCDGPHGLSTAVHVAISVMALMGSALLYMYQCDGPHGLSTAVHISV